MYRIMPIELRDANALVKQYHRHHHPAQGHRFSVGLWSVEESRWVGAAIVGRPVARLVDHHTTVEIVRLVTDGSKNACSMLYGACARIAKEMGYAKIQTYILDIEHGASLKASGWVMDLEGAGGGQWKHTDGKPRRTDQPICKKSRWAKVLNSEFEYRKFEYRKKDGVNFIQETMF